MSSAVRDMLVRDARDATHSINNYMRNVPKKITSEDRSSAADAKDFVWRGIVPIRRLIT